MKRWLVAMATLMIGSQAQARFRRVETQDVPLARLLDNAEKKLGSDGLRDPAAALLKHPELLDDVALLARLHALGWALNKQEPSINKETQALWFGYLPSIVPWGRRADPEPRTDAVKAHLDEAIRLYRVARVGHQDRIDLALGLAWCLAQQPDAAARKEAKAMLRQLGDDAWVEEGKRESWGMGQYGVASEAAAYLVPLLDKDKDAAEIAKLEARQRKVADMPRPITPIVVPLGDDTTLAGNIDADAAVRFDLDGSGRARAWGWVRPSAAWLVWDRDHDGQVTSGLDLFGSVTFWMFWRDGYAALAALDDDGDGLVSGDELAGLALWQDDGDGVAEPGEVVPVGDVGIVALRTDAALMADGVPWVDDGVVFADGTMRPTWDWISQGR